MRILICDDDALSIEKIQKLIRNYFRHIHKKCPEIICFNNGQDLLDDKGEKDIIFLDIEMPGMDGIYVGNELMKINKKTIIFVVTSFSEYLDDAMRFKVFRYLSKPIDKQRFYRNFEDAIDVYNSSSTIILVEDKQGVHKLTASDIIAVEAQGRKVIVHTITEDYISIHSIQYWEDNLPKNTFFRTHRSFIVNFEHINDFDHAIIHMFNGRIDAYLTRRKYTEFKEHYFLYLESAR